MCGLAGFLRFGADDDRAQRLGLLERMGRLLERRGPDEQQTFVDGDLSFVFRRLSIVDVAGGSQPIWNEDETIFVAVNGEIYNHRELRDSLSESHRFRTQSDSEIVLHLFEELGEKAFEKLNGMYAVVLWDTRKRQLLLARDRMGIKPLYYAEVGDTLLFGSELKALLVHPDCPREINWADMIDYGPQQKPIVSTYVKGIHHLPGGHLAVSSPGRALKARPYWQIRDHFGGSVELGTEAAIDRYDELLAESVRMRLMSDVPLGIFLSGGIDSALITAMAARHQVDLDCFTVVERTTWLVGDVQQARQVSEGCGMRLHPVLFDVDAMRDGFDLAIFEQQIALMESPRFDPEWYFKLQLHRMANAINPALKVVLLGQGADEFAGGYSARVGVEWAGWHDYLSNEIEPDLIRLGLADEGPPMRLMGTLSRDFADADDGSIYQRKMQRLTWQLQHFNLWHEDRTSSSRSIESRVPFLDHRLVELLAGLSPDLHESLFWDKAIVRAVLNRWLPEYPRDKRKVAFFVTDDMASIEQFVCMIALNVYPQFCQKYRAGNDQPFDFDRLDQAHRAVKSATGNQVYQAWQIIEAMATVVFMAFCRDPESFSGESGGDAMDHVRRIEPGEWPMIAARFEGEPPAVRNRQWRHDSRVVITPGCEVLTPLTEDEDAHVVMLYRDNQVQATMRVPEAAYWGVMILDKMGRGGEQLTVVEWAEKVQQSPSDVVTMLDNLVTAGFVEMVE